MVDEILKGCKKYVVERVISPNVFWMSENDRSKSLQKEVQHFEHLLAKNVKKYQDAAAILTGETVAVKSVNGFHRGSVTDIFKRSSKTIFWILLTDYGNVVETDETNIYFIKNTELLRKKLYTFEVSIHGIQPAAMKLEYENSVLGGIFQKRVCNDWSSAAFQFVRDLIQKNPQVFVKVLYKNETSISGEIYFIEEPDKGPVSLGQRLCSKGFAVVCDPSPKLMIQDNVQGDIDEKIPNKALFCETQNREPIKSLRLANKAKISNNKVKSVSDSVANVSPLQYVMQNLENKSFITSNVSSVFQSLSFEASPSQSFNSGSGNYSSSWISKKCQRINWTPSLCCDSYKTGDLPESKKMEISSENFKESVFRAVQRSVQTFDKHKQ